MILMPIDMCRKCYIFKLWS